MLKHSLRPIKKQTIWQNIVCYSWCHQEKLLSNTTNTNVNSYSLIVLTQQHTCRLLCWCITPLWWRYNMRIKLRVQTHQLIGRCLFQTLVIKVNKLDRSGVNGKLFRTTSSTTFNDSKTIYHTGLWCMSLSVDWNINKDLVITTTTNKRTVMRLSNSYTGLCEAIWLSTQVQSEVYKGKPNKGSLVRGTIRFGSYVDLNMEEEDLRRDRAEEEERHLSYKKRSRISPSNEGKCAGKRRKEQKCETCCVTPSLPSLSSKSQNTSASSTAKGTAIVTEESYLYLRWSRLFDQWIVGFHW